MDVSEEERDVKVQKAASGLLADFESSLKPFLWRTLGDGRLRIRKRVRHREAERLLRLVSNKNAYSYTVDNMS
jgi:tubulin-specific chaperone D